MDSPTVLRILDETSVIADLGPLSHDLLAAIREARALVGTAPPVAVDDEPTSSEETAPHP
jgi:hypothetical protein